MEKLLVHLYVPALMKDYDLNIPQEVRIGTLIPVLSQGIRELSNGQYKPSGSESLILRQADHPLNPVHTLYEYGARDGDDLMLI